MRCQWYHSGVVIYSKERRPGICGDSERTQVFTPHSENRYKSIYVVITVSTRLPKIFEERTTAQVLSGHDLCSCAFCLHLYLSDALLHLTWRYAHCMGMKEIYRPESGKSRLDGRNDQVKVILSCSYSSTRERDQLHGMAFYGMNDCRWLEKHRPWASRQLQLRGPAIYKWTSVPLMHVNILQISRRWPAGFEQAIQFDENMAVMDLSLSLCPTTLLSCPWKPWKDSTKSRSGPKDKKYVTTAAGRWVSHNGDRSLCDD